MLYLYSALTRPKEHTRETPPILTHLGQKKLSSHALRSLLWYCSHVLALSVNMGQMFGDGHAAEIEGRRCLLKVCFRGHIVVPLR
jgi:hypothetical protein